MAGVGMIFTVTQEFIIMKRISLFGAIPFLMVACSGRNPDDNTVSALPLDRNGIQMNVGDSWLYRRSLINIGMFAATGAPDTLVGYSYFQAAKDTIIDAKEYLIIEGRDYDVGKDTICIYKKRSAIHFSDSAISMYEFKTGDYGFMSGVLKTAASALFLTKDNYGMAMLKKMEIARLLKSANYDTNVYWDFVYPVIFPLIKNAVYTYRDSMDSNGNLPYRRKFLGIESINVPSGAYDAYKFEWLVKEALGIDSVYGFDWDGAHGLLKRYFDLGNNYICDDLGILRDTCRSYDILEHIGNADINPDTLVPWGRR
jgi:hypothetical protein